ncbi:NBR1-Ig-like domain-containing protein [Actinoplanes sp. NPDC051513]|uniref:NBR1-Ig-like domain-containing protein n=1 Tax=Actinoplanes sp. NPDC051513 TaxID=3363908 RepID=UPI0037A9B716
MEAQRAATETKQQVTAAAGFAEQLRGLRAGVGDPSFRKMAGRSGRISHTTLHEAAAGTRFPSWETTREFVRACEADEAEWRLRWEDAQRTIVPDTVDAKPTVVTPTVVTPTVVTPTVVTPSEFVPAASRTLELAAPRPVPIMITVARWHWWRWLAAATVVAAIVAALGLTSRGREREDSGAAAPSPAPSAGSSAASSDALIAGDASRFVGDVTIPDGTRVKVKAHFVKVWAIANVGTVGWHHRFLAPAQPAGDDNGCQVPSRVEIGDTLPGEQVMISVPVVAPSRPGRCWVSWKMVDENGRAYFPSRRPVYFLVNVTD